MDFNAFWEIRFFIDFIKQAVILFNFSFAYIIVFILFLYILST